VDDQFEEFATCLLSACWERQFGFSAWFSLELVGFVYMQDDIICISNVVANTEIFKIEKALQWLINVGLIDHDFNPNHLVII